MSLDDDFFCVCWFVVKEKKKSLFFTRFWQSFLFYSKEAVKEISLHFI